MDPGGVIDARSEADMWQVESMKEKISLIAS
jgi:hypothetical protein